MLLSITLATLMLGVISAGQGSLSAGKWVTTSGLLATMSGVVQLEVSGLIDKLIQRFGDGTRYPYGPPSSITREIIDNPDTPVRTGLRNVLFLNMKTGFWLILTGTALQVMGVWL